MNRNQNLEKLYQTYLDSSGVTTDSRKMRENQLFFALSGPNFDGNFFVEDALKKGALGVVSDDKKNMGKPKIFYSEDVLKTLQALATYHRKKFNIPMIAITGSNGKTTVKTLVSLALATKYKTYATYKNLNNHIGVPLTLLSMPLDTEMAVIEMGASKFGDIHELCEIAHPTHGIITNIGKAHTEGFGDILGVIKGKTELYRYLKEQRQSIFVNREGDTILHAEGICSEPIAFDLGQELALTEVHPFLAIKYKDKTYKTNLMGAYNFENICAAVAIASHFGVSMDKSCTAIANYIPKDSRNQWIKTKDNNILLDAYNANPTSMKVSLTSFLESEAPNKVVIVGDMMEVKNTDLEHRFLGNFISKYDNIKTVIYVGRQMLHALPSDINRRIFQNRNNNPEIQYFENTSMAIDYLSKNPIYDSTIFIKGSRASTLEKIVDYL